VSLKWAFVDWKSSDTADLLIPLFSSNHWLTFKAKNMFFIIRFPPSFSCSDNRSARIVEIKIRKILLYKSYADSAKVFRSI